MEDKALRKKLEEMRKNQQMEQQKKELLLKLLEPAAYERIMNVRMASPAVYDGAVAAVAYLYQNGQVKGKISDTQLLSLLKKLTAKREGEIKFMRK